MTNTQLLRKAAFVSGHSCLLLGDSGEDARPGTTLLRKARFCERPFMPLLAIRVNMAVAVVR